MTRRLLPEIEFVVFFLAAPVALFLFPARMAGHITLWLVSFYALFVMRRMRGFSWRELWHGRGWSADGKKHALLRFIASTAAVLLFACLVAPEKLFNFPTQRPWFWLIVMILYPLLSALPQEFVLRSYFFRRYGDLFGDGILMIGVNAFVFGLIHVMFHNWISPLLSMVAGGLFAYSYTQHRSLKWAALEHALYGNMVFTIGLGTYFLGHLRP